MMNNCWFRVKRKVWKSEKGEIGIVLEHPTQPGNQSGGWMAKEKQMEKSWEWNQTIKNSVSSPSAKTYSIHEVREHKQADSAWIIVNGKVYDCTGYLKDHPGGTDSILINAGTDCTEEFEAIHSDKAQKMLEEYRIGEVMSTGYASDSTSPNTTVHGNSDSIHLAPIKEVMSPVRSVALNPGEKIPCRLVSKASLSDDVRLLRFALPSEEQVMGLPVGKHIFLCATVEEKLCMRAYTPTSSVDEVGYFDLVVKVYLKGVHPNFPNGGLMSQHLDSLPIGSILDVKGPLGHIEYTGMGNFLFHGKPIFANTLAMLAGGTGITPIYQVAQAILKDPYDRTHIHVLYANRTQDDILLREELDDWARKHDRFKVWYVVETATQGWAYSVGFITQTILRDHLPPPSPHTLALTSGPPPMIQFAVKPNLEKLGYDVENNLLVF
ncbi:hypothetical protein VNO78_01449 [Psophocarpus tetragonolobus]